MIRQFTFPEQRRLLAAVVILLISCTGCTSKPAAPGYHVKLSVNTKENSYLTGIISSRNRDSIIKCADADYHENKYYIFRTIVPFEGKFEDYLIDYAKQKYKLILVNCGAKSCLGAYYYNAEMDKLFADEQVKRFGVNYLEAKNLYNKELNTRLAGY